jgi:hypothetical protein
MYSLVARVKEILQSVSRTARFAVGLPRDDSTYTGYVRGCSSKELIHGREAEQCRAACAAKSMLRSYERVGLRSYELRYQEFLEHPDWQVNLARWRLRTGICCLAEANGRWNGVAVADRRCECPAPGATRHTR